MGVCVCVTREGGRGTSFCCSETNVGRKGIKRGVVGKRMMTAS